MRRLVSGRRPLLLLSSSLCYLLAVLFFLRRRHYYSLISSAKCRRSSDRKIPDSSTFFSYPHSYGHHKYALSTHRSSCSNPLFFSDYATAHDSIRDFPFNSSSVLRYLRAGNYHDHQSFGGNFTIQKRFSYFDHRDDQTAEIPCGFFNKFPVTNSDRIEMGKCEGVVVVSAIFNDHDKIRQPRGLAAQTLATTCFFMFVDYKTLNELIQHHKLISPNDPQPKIGVWRLVCTIADDQVLYENPAMNGVIPKYLVHRLFPNSKFSIWIDAKLQLMVDPFLLLHALVVSKDVDMAISKHPFYVHTMEEAVATARWKKWWDVGALALQMGIYCQNGLHPWSPNKLPYPSDVPDSALILRKHGVESNLFSCLMFNELEAFNPRDQLAFAFVRDQMKPKVNMNMFEVEVFEQVVLEYRHNLKKLGSMIRNQEKTTKTHHLLVNDSCFSSCTNYLSEMWGESHD